MKKLDTITGETDVECDLCKLTVGEMSRLHYYDIQATSRAANALDWVIGERDLCNACSFLSKITV